MPHIQNPHSLLDPIDTTIRADTSKPTMCPANSLQFERENSWSGGHSPPPGNQSHQL